MPDRRSARAPHASGVRSRIVLPVETALGEAAHPVCIVSRGGTLVATNDAWRQLRSELGARVADVGEPYDLPFDDAHGARLHEAIVDVAHDRSASPAPVRVRLAGRDEAWMEVQAEATELEQEPCAVVQHWWVTADVQSERRRRMSAACTVGSLGGAKDVVARRLADAAGWTAHHLRAVEGGARFEGLESGADVTLAASHPLARGLEPASLAWLTTSDGALPPGTRAVCLCPCGPGEAFVLASPSPSRPDDETLALVRRWLCVEPVRARTGPSNDVLVDRAAGSDATVLLLGESGTGKTRLARTIHDRSARASRPFLDLNCAGLAIGLLESELFGHERGAFTGAHQRKRGLLELAEGGTVLLDEIGELDPIVQAKLLKVLETRTFRRVGGEQEIAADVRFVGATNRDLRGEVRAGRFRADLYYRLAVVEIRLPPLREREGEIAAIANVLLAAIHTAGPLRLSDAARRELTQRDWPGNIRELRNALERAALLAHDGVIDVDEVRAATPRSVLPPPQDLLDDHAWRHVTSVLESTGYNVRRAAGLLGVARSTLYEWTRRRGIDLKTHRHADGEKGRS